jgi:hypothetical protein
LPSPGASLFAAANKKPQRQVSINEKPSVFKPLSRSNSRIAERQASIKKDFNTNRNMTDKTSPRKPNRQVSINENALTFTKPIERKVS